MTSLAAPAAPRLARGSRRANLAWNAWRQHRMAIIGLLAVFAGVALLLVLTGVSLRRAHMSASWVIRYGGMTMLPVLAGVFLGAPLVARDFETGSYRFALTQGVSARRQLASRLLLAGAVVAIGSCLLGLLVMWAIAPLHQDGVGYPTGLSYWEPDYFNITAVTLPAWALLDFSLGALAGAAIRRTVPAMAVTLAGVLLAALMTGFAVTDRHSLAGPLLTVAPAGARLGLPSLGELQGSLGASQGGQSRLTFVVYYPSGQPGPQGSWQVSGWFTGEGGQRFSEAAVRSMVRRIPLRVAQSQARLRAWLADRQISYWTGYQPASRYWLFQGAFAAILVALAMVASLIAVRLLRRGAA